MKKTLQILLVITLTFACVFSLVPAQACVDGETNITECYFNDFDYNQDPNIIIGDANFDGTIDGVDALFALIYSHEMYNPYTRISGMKHAPYNVYLNQLFSNFSEDRENDKLEDAWQRYYYYFNSAIVADVDNSGTVDAVDALHILQYAVTKRTSFERKDMECDGVMFYVPWPDEWNGEWL